MAGKLLLLLAGLLAILAIALFYVMPDIFGLWGVTSVLAGVTIDSMTFGGFSSFQNVTLLGTQSSLAMDLYLMAGAALVVIGAIIAILGALKESKGIGMLGGLLILAGPLLLIASLIMGLGVFGNYLSAYTNLGMTGTLIMGSIDFAGVGTLTYGLKIGAYMLIAAGVIGLIGGMTLSD